MKHLHKYLSAPLAYALALILFGAPSAPGTSTIPTVGGSALAMGEFAPLWQPYDYNQSDYDWDDCLVGVGVASLLSLIVTVPTGLPWVSGAVGTAGAVACTLFVDEGDD